MLNHNKIINNIRIIKKYDQFHINNLIICIIHLAYKKLSTHLTQKQKELENRCPLRSYWCPVGRVLRVFGYKRRHTKKQPEKNLQSI
jgi:hypothetical protein